MVLIDCGRAEDNIERKFALLPDLVNRAEELGTTHIGWAEALRSLAHEPHVCMCLCWPKPCHGNLIIDEIKRRLE
jgi:hypothetical protein